jgi:CRISPR-associated protein Csb3
MSWFYVPIWDGAWRSARLRSVLASQFLRTLATTGLGLNEHADTDASAVRAWLARRDVTGVMRFPVHKFGSDKAQERRAMHGETVPVPGAE